jgi:hypothetical protein
LSPVAIDALRDELRVQRPDLVGCVELRAQPAHVSAGLLAGSYDVVVLNSVVQYFPGFQYLREVMDAALRLLAPGGSILIGDVRNLALQRHFTAAVARHPGGRSADVETELLIDPRFFVGLAERSPRITGVDIQIERGRAHNELTRYRYDVVLTTAPTAAVSLATLPEMTWGADIADTNGLAELIASDPIRPVRIRGLPNARLGASAPDPEDVIAMVEAAGRRAVITWSPRAVEQLEVLVLGPGTRAPLTDVLLAGPRPWPARLTNSPLRQQSPDRPPEPLLERMPS